MEFKNFASRTNSLNDIKKFGKEKIGKQKQHRFVMKGGRIEIKYSSKV